jgi:hypothetical protein
MPRFSGCHITGRPYRTGDIEHDPGAGQVPAASCIPHAVALMRFLRHRSTAVSAPRVGPVAGADAGRRGARAPVRTAASCPARRARPR